MLYKLAHELRNKIPWVWRCIEFLNSIAFGLRYGNVKKVEGDILPKYEAMLELRIVPMKDCLTKDIVDFFSNQSQESFRYFKPHKFDNASLVALQKDKSHLAYILKADNRIVGYCFLRCYFYGKAFRGRYVSSNYRGRGLGTMENHLLDEIGFGLGLRIFESVSKNNVPSYRSALSASEVKVVAELPNNKLILEVLENQNKH